MTLDETAATGTVARHLAALAAATPNPLEVGWDTEPFSATLDALAPQEAATV